MSRDGGVKKVLFWTFELPGKDFLTFSTLEENS